MLKVGKGKQVAA